MSNYPAIMGFIKFAILATLGEIIARWVLAKKGEFNFALIKKMHLWERALVWGFLGVIISYVFTIYSVGIDTLITQKRLLIIDMDNENIKNICVAFWKSFWMNLLFALPLMTFHRVTDTLIDRKELFKFGNWPITNVLYSIDWKNIWTKVAPTIIWFWIPAHTITFTLPAEYRVFVAALLSICLGLILALMKAKTMNATK
ncbi:MAG: hypothetical protein HQK51_02775 [Oligoflexia bacterium]|nr:hypothetical protein [Oligoflexia bacterium]